MPFVQLASSDMNFHYVVGSSADMQTVDPQKETLLMLHPGLCDLHCKLLSDYLPAEKTEARVPDFDAQFHDPRLTSKYNLVAFDARGVSPRSSSSRQLVCAKHLLRLQHGLSHATPLPNVTLERKGRLYTYPGASCS